MEVPDRVGGSAGYRWRDAVSWRIRMKQLPECTSLSNAVGLTILVKAGGQEVGSLRLKVDVGVSAGRN